MSHVSNIFYNMLMIKFNENDNNEGELLIEDMNESKKRKYNLFVAVGLFERDEQNQ